ncbi:hypothetical protein [Rubrivivax gelatinosus]|uniref:DUF4440 domain-containing protein n=1 Tax=Rubrivivax gelatinosus TaxID=28068 RepID=A0ABS1E0I7_RUBGE|nr:hypothetical protein [Rubrivivax gelatinosus]MBK1715852.1 hypothetical protein [Rubrivivax gelatinosus]
MAPPRSESPPPCCSPQPPADWSTLLPPDLLPLVVQPLRCERFADDELPAERTLGYAADGSPSFCVSRHRLLAPASDDDEDFVESTAVSECTTAWRLRDGGWLVHRSVLSFGQCPPAENASYYLTETMPR